MPLALALLSSSSLRVPKGSESEYIQMIGLDYKDVINIFFGGVYHKYQERYLDRSNDLADKTN